MHPKPVLATSGRGSRRGHGASQPHLLLLLPSSKDLAPSGTPCSALHRSVAATTASADSCPPIPTSLDAGSTPETGGRTTGLPRRVTFVPYTWPIYDRTLRVTLGFGLDRSLARMQPPPMSFLFVRPALCLQLPSDPASRRRPCCSASGSHHQGPQRTLTSKSSAGYQPGQAG